MRDGVVSSKLMPFVGELVAWLDFLTGVFLKRSFNGLSTGTFFGLPLFPFFLSDDVDDGGDADDGTDGDERDDVDDAGLILFWFLVVSLGELSVLAASN